MEQHPVDSGKVLLGQSKSNIGPLGRTQVFTKREGQFEWCGVSRLSAELIAGSGRGPDPYAFLEAVCWLEETLAKGIMKRSDTLQSEANEEGIASKTLFRAKKALGVQSLKDGEVWYWKLPDLPIINPPLLNTLSDPLDLLGPHGLLDLLGHIQFNQLDTSDTSVIKEDVQDNHHDQVSQDGQVSQVVYEEDGRPSPVVPLVVDETDKPMASIPHTCVCGHALAHNQRVCFHCRRPRPGRETV